MGRLIVCTASWICKGLCANDVDLRLSAGGLYVDVGEKDYWLYKLGTAGSDLVEIITRNAVFVCICVYLVFYL